MSKWIEMVGASLGKLVVTRAGWIEICGPCEPRRVVMPMRLRRGDRDDRSETARGTVDVMRVSMGMEEGAGSAEVTRPL